MFKDRNEELKRLEEELLEEETEEEVCEEDIYEEDEFYEDDEVYEEDDPEKTRVIPETVRHYRVKSTDRLDVDLESFSREVEQGNHSSGRGLVLLMVLLSLAVAAVLLYYVFRYGGLLS